MDPAPFPPFGAFLCGVLVASIVGFIADARRSLKRRKAAEDEEKRLTWARFRSETETRLMVVESEVKTTLRSIRSLDETKADKPHVYPVKFAPSWSITATEKPAKAKGRKP